MKVFCGGPGVGHRPRYELDGGRKVPAHEIPDRVRSILATLGPLPGVELVAPPSLPVERLYAVHRPDYVEHLRTGGRPDGGGAYPSVFPGEPGHVGRGPKARRGQFTSDTYTPLFAGTFAVALGSAAAADSLNGGGERVVYAMCRPPGHHAEPARSGGYCYLNNAALAAHALARLGPVAVLDLDVHHGNGTQRIFYDRSDVATASIHGDPTDFFPHFTGYPDETGSGPGTGVNRNLPLPKGTGESAYQAALESALGWLAGFRPPTLVVAFGADTHESDPLGCFALPTPYFRRMGATVRQLGVPTVVVQEGGYNLDHIGPTVAAFLGGLTDGWPAV